MKIPINPQSAPSRDASTLAAVICIAAVLLTCAGPPQDDASLLPDAIGEWAGGEISEYVGDDLFAYIDGGAEIYHEHGFERIEVREYGRGEEIVSVELYTMSRSAYGIYSYARSQSGEPITLGAGGTIADYYLHFWSGPHLVAVTSHAGGTDTRTGILEIANGVGKAMPATGEVPKLMERLPVQGCVAGSEIYIAGGIGLNNAAPVAAELFEGFSEGATTECGSARLVALEWENAAAAEAALDRAKTRALQIGEYRIEAASDDRFSIRFDEDGFAAAARTGEVVRIAIDHGAVEDLDVVFPTTGWEVDNE